MQISIISAIIAAFIKFMKIILERNKCIGCGACSAVCPVYWKMGNDGKSELMGSKETEPGIFEKEIEKIEGCANDAEDGCPVQCIHVKK